MSDYDEYSGDDYGGDWLYVEDHYDEADNLAEHTCPSPVYEVNVDEDIGEYDPYDYWEDLTYLSDSYHDADPKPRRPQTQTVKQPGKSAAPKPKITKGVGSRKSQSKSKLPAGKSRLYTPVVWLSSEERDAVGRPERVKLTEVRGDRVEILKDWRERFKNATGFHTLSQDNGSEEGAVVGDGFDLNPASVAQLLSSDDAINQIKDMLERQGLDPDAIEVVMRDLITGKDPSDAPYDDEDEDAVSKRGTGASIDDTGLVEDTIPGARPLSNDSGARTLVSVPNLAEARGSSETAQDADTPETRRPERGNGTSPSKLTMTRRSPKQAPSKPGKRTRLRSPSPEGEPVAKRSRQKKVNYKGMQ